MTEILNQPVVVFSKNYLPISRVNVRRAVILMVTGKAEAMEAWQGPVWEVRSPSLVLNIPAQIRLTLTNNERVWNVPPVTRREVLRRDKHTCQYCGSKHYLTLDHVLPRSKGGKHTWDNVVIACERCNSRKGDRTPSQAGMLLATKPKAPAHPALLFAEQFWRECKQGTLE